MSKICVIDTCDRDAVARFLCRPHYKRMHEQGRISEFPLMARPRARTGGRNKLTYTLPSDPALIYSKEDAEASNAAKPPIVWNILPIGSRRVYGSGYVFIKTEKGIVPEHIHVMEQQLGRLLIRGEEVKHKNGVIDDNSIDNLELYYKETNISDLVEYVARYHLNKVLAVKTVG